MSMSQSRRESIEHDDEHDHDEHDDEHDDEHGPDQDQDAGKTQARRRQDAGKIQARPRQDPGKTQARPRPRPRLRGRRCGGLLYAAATCCGTTKAGQVACVDAACVRWAGAVQQGAEAVARGGG
ncbi:hypothetical protein ST47_g7938 [Ascochyta rabiei]|uniref:Uncharacterized protein n=1 Tax=Didymella rabiei TaxID=5454 RepID=A0A162ZZF9_DIDRA|nr:hypothetical protein ST47_g7938 [Ascochyta rabiei]